jgi:hypothetical protein
MYRAGMPPSEISRILGVKVTTMRSWFAKEGIPADRKRRVTSRAPDAFVRVIIGLHKKGLPASEIGRIVNRSESTVQYYLRRNGVQRTHSESLKLAYAQGRRKRPSSAAMADTANVRYDK